MSEIDLSELMHQAGPQALRCSFSDEELHTFARYAHTAQENPIALVVELIRERARAHGMQMSCEQATEAATNLQKLLEDLLEGNASFYQLETIRETPAGMRAVCRSNESLRELSIHPDVDVEQLRGLKAWEYVTVHQDVVIGCWANDDSLYTRAMGPLVEFKGYQDVEAGTVQIADGPQERIAILDPSLKEVELKPHQKLVLHRADPTRVIAAVSAENVHSRFEVPLDQIHTRLEDLAGLDDLASQLLEDILVRICRPDVRDKFGLEPLKGVLLYSYKAGMGKTAFMRGITRWLGDHSDQYGFDISLFHVAPGSTKSMWHGEDARIVREELWGAIRARQSLPRSRPLVIIVVMDEIDSLGKRAGPGDRVTGPGPGAGAPGGSTGRIE